MRYLFAVVITGISTFSEAQANTKPVDSLKLNQVQIVATHNSYHKKTDAAVFRFLRFIHSFGILPQEFDPRQIDYTKASLSEQLDKQHAHGLELDVWNDPEGGRFYHRMGKAYVFKKTASGFEELKQPGYKLLHIPDFDFLSTNFTFISSLKEIKLWSDAHPDHLPVFINVELETATPGDQVSFLRNLTHAAPVDSVAVENLDKEVRSVFGENLDGVITPDRVRGNYATLEQAVLSGNWPLLTAARGKVIFIIDGDGTIYKKGHPSFKGRAMFVYSKPGTPEAAFVILNDPIPDFKEIQQRVKEGYIVRTRTDEGTIQARTGDRAEMNAALSSWAQIISTDYIVPDARAGKKGWTDFHVDFPGGSHARIDSISAGGWFYKDAVKE